MQDIHGMDTVPDQASQQQEQEASKIQITITIAQSYGTILKQKPKDPSGTEIAAGLTIPNCLQIFSFISTMLQHTTDAGMPLLNSKVLFLGSSVTFKCKGT